MDRVKQSSAVALSQPKRKATAVHPTTDQDTILGLQRTVGNTAVSTALQRRPPTDETTPSRPDHDADVAGGNPETKAWQRFLNASEPGLPERLVIDGIAGPKSETAAQLWQWRQQLPIVGLPKGPAATPGMTTHGGGL